MTDTSSANGDNRFYREKTYRVIAGRSLDEWREFARRDDCLDRMVPSDLRQLIGAIPESK